MRMFLNILLIILIAATVSICFVKPEMHKTVFVYDSDYRVVPETEIEIEKADIPVMEQPVKPKTETVKIETKVVPKTKTIQKESVKKVVPQNQVKKQVTKTTTTANNSVKKVQTTQPNKTEKDKVAQKQQTIVVSAPEQIKTVQEKITERPVIKAEEQKPQPKVLTQQEETIAWNVWRSRLQNRIMQDTKLPYIPNGVEFRFSFTVDKYGKISNLQTWSKNQGYTPYAIQYIAPVIRNYQGRTILNFPEGTERISTQVTGGWRISDNEKYSNPSDYNDIEKVKR